MSFLAPLFLAGALGVALPILFHLIRRTARERQPFSSLMFLQPTPPRVTKRSRIEHLFLLLLRCLVLCLLAAGFARPFLQKPMSAAPHSNAGRRIILLLDTSASMQRDNLWPSALARAEEILNAASPADQVAVAVFDRQVRSLVSFEQWSAWSPAERAALGRQSFTDVKPGWAASHLGNALIAATGMMLDADKQDQHVGPRRIVLVTDFQEGSRLEGLQGFDWPRGVEVVVDPVKARRPTNAGLQWVLDSVEVIQTDSRPRLRISNAANAKREQFQIHWDGIAGASPLDVYVPPGQSRIVEPPKLPEGAAGERLILTGDDEAFDNTVHLVQAKPQVVNVLFVGADAEGDPAQLLYYLKRAFQSTRRYSVQITARSPDASPLDTDLKAARLLIAGGPLSENWLASVTRFLQEGGSVLFVVKETGALRTLGQLAGADSVTGEEARAGGYAMFGRIDFTHPLFAPLADPRFSDFTKIHFWKHRRLDTARIPGARVLAEFDSGDAALLEVPRGKGNLWALTAGWHPADSQLALSSKFVPLLHSMLELAGGIQAQLTQYQVGDEVDLSSALDVSRASPTTVRNPDGSQVQLAAGESRFARTDHPGIYTVLSAQPTRFVVNLAPSESQTALLALDELERLGVPMKPDPPDLKKQVEQKRRLQNAELEGQQKLWRWLLVAALVVLMMETWLAGLLTRRTVTRTEATL